MIARTAWFSIGCLAMVCAVLGAALPLLPTVPFLLVAAYAFAQSSERWHAWLINHRVFGPMIDDWHKYGAIDRRSKIFAVLMMLAAIGLSVAMAVKPWVIGLQAVVIVGAATFILTRPSPPSV